MGTWRRLQSRPYRDMEGGGGETRRDVDVGEVVGEYSGEDDGMRSTVETRMEPPMALLRLRMLGPLTPITMILRKTPMATEIRLRCTFRLRSIWCRRRPRHSEDQWKKGRSLIRILSSVQRVFRRGMARLRLMITLICCLLLLKSVAIFFCLNL